MTRVIINADDFGRTFEVNRAVIRAHEEGILTSASLMIAGDASEDAVRLAREHPTLAVGLHVVVVDGPAVLPAERVDRVVRTDGRFANAPVRLGLRYAWSRSAPKQLAAELRAQFERFAETGLPLSHVDGHQHMHLHPVVFNILLPLAREFGARGIRIVRDDLRLALRFDRRHAAAKIASAVVFSMLAAWCRRRCAGTGLEVARRTYGFYQSGAMRERYIRDVIRALAGADVATAEIYFHPTCGERLDALGPNPGDLESLVSPAVRDAIRQLGLRVSTYAELSEPTLADEVKASLSACHAP